VAELMILFLMKSRQYLGMLAGTLTTLAFLPQAAKIIKDRQTRDISLSMYVLFCSGVALWLVYGLLLDSSPLIISNAVTLLLAGMVLFLKIKNG
jgi:MtN3 and saliva related transmembrane protein